MQTNRLGQTDLAVSVIGLGTVKFGRNQGVKYPHEFALPSDADILKLLAVSRDLGINLLDTAPAYGVSEERLGKLLKNTRRDFIISTKVGEEFIEGVSHFDFSKAAIIQSVDRSLKRLQTDYLDIVLVHSNGDDENLINKEAVFVTLAALKKAGKIRAFGMSTKTIAGGLLTIEQADLAMVAFHQAYTDEVEVIRQAREQQKGIFIKKALASGHLPMKASVSDALRFVLSEEGVSSVIIGTLNAAHLEENVRAIVV